eukprot:scaffold235434_cov19-Tisochrysis_lutea.AAC.2
MSDEAVQARSPQAPWNPFLRPSEATPQSVRCRNVDVMDAGWGGMQGAGEDAGCQGCKEYRDIN